MEQRLPVFLTENINQLYNNSRKVKSLTPTQKAEKNKLQTNFLKTKPCPKAADNDQYKSMIVRVSSTTHIAINTTKVVNILKELYQKIQYHNRLQEYNPKRIYE